MSLAKTVISLGNNQNLSAFHEDNIFVHREAIPERTPFVITGMQAMRVYEWNLNLIGFDFIPIALFGFKTVPFTSSLDLNVSIKDFTYQTLVSFNLNGAINIQENALYYEFPNGAIMSKNEIITVSSDTAIDSLKIICKKCFLSSPIPPNVSF